ncbi:MAG: ribonuclease HII [Deltaproteobacteria bacterium]|nr:ribonuclease HII [Deltaproteobacteria bacterium]
MASGNQSGFFDEPDENDLCVFERRLWRAGHTHVAGLDEVGRGPLAGPVVAAAVVLPEGCLLPGVTDSKKLSSAQRRALLPSIFAHAMSVSVAFEPVAVIDQVNILRASQRAMLAAVAQMPAAPTFLLVDGNQKLSTTLPQQTIVKGDRRSLSIAAASIVAKEFRDALMLAMHRRYPQYGFDTNAGYGTARHLAALAQHGPCPLHRRTFSPIREMVR